MSVRPSTFRPLPTVVCAAIILASACGGGSAGSATTTPTTPSVTQPPGPVTRITLNEVSVDGLGVIVSGARVRLPATIRFKGTAEFATPPTSVVLVGVTPMLGGVSVALGAGNAPSLTAAGPWEKILAVTSQPCRQLFDAGGNPIGAPACFDHIDGFSVSMTGVAPTTTPFVITFE
jgi:hypothetical protein